MIEKVSSKISHAEIFGGICALFCLVGAFLPWGTVSSVFGSVSVSGIDRDGMITFILSLLAFGALYWGVMKKKEGVASVAIILLGLIIALIAVVDGNSLAELSSESEYVYMQVGMGLYITGIGGVGLIFAGLWIFSKRVKSDKSSREIYCSDCGRTVPDDANICPYCGEKFDNA